MPIDDDSDPELTAVGIRPDVAAAVSRKTTEHRPWLIVVSGAGSIGRMYRLEHRIVLGRSSQCDVRIDEEGVSRRHAALECSAQGKVELLDLGSRNGTFVNGEQVSRKALRDGDKIQIGETTILKLSYQDELDEALQRNLYESATRDGLTHAVNKRGFHEALTKEHAFARRHGRALSLLAFDVDHFKRVNDTHGHLAGDAVLKGLAALVAATIRREDVFARIGGEEFALLLRDIPRERAIECAERVRRSVEQTPVDAEGVRLSVTISIGVATLGPEHGEAGALLEAADKALYEAKKAGRNRVCVATSHVPR